MAHCADDLIENSQNQSIHLTGQEVNNINQFESENERLGNGNYTEERNDVELIFNREHATTQVSLHSLAIPSPSSSEEKHNTTVKHATKVLGFLYSIFLFILGVLAFSSDITVFGQSFTAILTLYILVTGLTIMSVLFVDIIRYTRAMENENELYIRKRQEAMDLRMTQQIEQDSGVARDFSDNGTELNYLNNPEDFNSKIKHNYCFITGRHATSAYLKFGAAAFGLGHFVHHMLLIFMQVKSFSIKSPCHSVMQMIVDITYPVFSFLQLFFIFKFSNVVILKRQTLASVTLLHLIASNLCLWTLAVVRETQLALDMSWANNQTVRVSDADSDCRPSPLVIRVFECYSPYLYPFSVEFNVLIAGLFFTIWCNIGHCKHKTVDGQSAQPLIPRSSIETQGYSLNINISCQGSSRGMFAGILVFVFVITVIILGFVFGEADIIPLQEFAVSIGNYARLLIYITMLFCVMFAYYRTRRLDVNQHPLPWLDEVLLFICAPAFFMDSIFTTVATINILNVVKIIGAFTMSLQMVLQTAFIVDGLRRCSNSRKLRRTKPGRELVMYLLITNIALWVLNTVSYQPPESKSEMYLYYGKKLWTILGHVINPLIMLYRFHSSACLADIWTAAYKPGIDSY